MEQSAINRASQSHTTFTAWFELNKIDIEARQLLYHETPLHYVFDESKKKWNKRKNNAIVIGRMYAVSPKEG